MSLFGREGARRRRVGARERVLASAFTDEGHELCGTRRALFVVPADDGAPCRFGWEEIHSATWDATTSSFVLRETQGAAAVHDEHRFVLVEATRLLDLVRERVQASLLLQRSIELPGGDAQLVVRRGHAAGDAVTWSVAWPAGVDRTAPAVVAAVDSEMQRVREELGLPDA